jgi:catechol 2,3-dioxygenase-like lactoylglutathione lyase family enzyme
MSIALQTAGIHHLALRVTDLARAHVFYGRTLGFPIVLETRDSFLALAGHTVLVIRRVQPETTAGDRFDASRVGLDHAALACGSETELERTAAALDAAKVPSTSLRFDPVLKRRYVAFTDPDGIAWEFYMAPELESAVADD